MARAMTKSQIITKLADQHDLSKKTMNLILDELASLAYKEAKKSFTLPGIGKLQVKLRKARTGRNPQTGEAINISAKKVLKFRVLKVAKDAVVGKK